MFVAFVVLQKIFAKLGVRLKGFHALDDRLPRRLFGDVVLKRGFGFVVVPVGLDEPDETPDELAAESVEMEPFDESGCDNEIKIKMFIQNKNIIFLQPYLQIISIHWRNDFQLQRTTTRLY